jgi:enoyl-CoA hydratase/carnithine racemase
VADLERFGLFNAVVPIEELRESTRRMLERVTPRSPTVVASQKRLFEIWQNRSLTDGIAASLDEFAQVFASPETAPHLAAHRATVGRGDRTDAE